ncbi:MAG TPA: N-acetyltransferase [Planctomycetes bacterium]|nr:N-acetyltransferase [Planctomycetota bacterium]HIK59371.1 N-acetyltransferase [Planctomycetota bacterium]
MGESRADALVSGKHVLLRHPCLEDQEEYLALVRASREFHRPWEPIPPQGVPAVDSPEGFQLMIFGAANPQVERMMLCRLEDGAIVGRFCFNEIVRGAFDSAYLSYWMGAPFACQGYGREGIELALQHAFEGIGLHRVEANIQPHNEPSLALARGGGFLQEGFSKRYLQIAGEWADHERWAITIEDWRERRDNAP